MNEEKYIWKTPPVMAALFLGVVGALFYAAFDSLVEMERRWGSQEEYGYAYLIPVIVGFFIWQRKLQLQTTEFKYSWGGLALLISGLGITFLGILSATDSIVQYGVIVSFIGAVYLFTGYPAFKILLPPLLLLFLVVPLPAFFYNNLSSTLQLISSQLGVWVIRLFGVSVYLEGNVIDLGVYKLQVVEACSGLRYLFPLFSLSLIASFIFQAAFWKRLVIVLSSIPITVLMNSFRIGMIGVLVEFGGIEQAEGFLHYFEGWIIFMACTAILVFEMWLFVRFGRNKQKLSDAFGIDWPEAAPEDFDVKTRAISGHYYVATGFVLAAAILIGQVGGREDIIPDRKLFTEFPTHISSWKGRADRLESIYLDALKLDDYILVDYSDDQGNALNFYVAYYGSQRTGQAAHSPKSCLPGGGWRIEEITQKKIQGSGPPDVLHVNRVLIRKGDHTQLVYYWFKQRGRDITNEYLVKWYLFWDAMTKKRTDGALVRVVAQIPAGGDVSVAEEMMQSFTRSVIPYLDQYVPD